MRNNDIYYNPVFSGNIDPLPLNVRQTYAFKQNNASKTAYIPQNEKMW